MATVLTPEAIDDLVFSCIERGVIAARSDDAYLTGDEDVIFHVETSRSLRVTAVRKDDVREVLEQVLSESAMLNSRAATSDPNTHDLTFSGYRTTAS